MIITSESGFMYGGIAMCSLYRKVSTDSVHTTPRMAASSIRCCSLKWLRGSNSKIKTWFTPEDLFLGGEGKEMKTIPPQKAVLFNFSLPPPVDVNPHEEYE